LTIATLREHFVRAYTLIMETGTVIPLAGVMVHTRTVCT